MMFLAGFKGSSADASTTKNIYSRYPVSNEKEKHMNTCMGCMDTRGERIKENISKTSPRTVNDWKAASNLKLCMYVCMYLHFMNDVHFLVNYRVTAPTRMANRLALPTIKDQQLSIASFHNTA